MLKPYNQRLKLIEWAIIILPAIIPLFISFPYRINLFLAWEGAYRIASGEIPYRDFGTPVGYVFWLLPALFFKIFGPYVVTLIKVQVLINWMGSYAFSRILQHLGLDTGGRIIALTVFTLSYTLFNFWPWYNHLVFILQLLSLLFLLKSFDEKRGWWTIPAALMAALAFMTKQDTGGLTLVLCGALLIYDGWISKSFRKIIIFSGAYLLAMALLILPFLAYDFGYWFNLGQPPHFSRLTLFDFMDEFLGASKWIKFYLLMVLVMLVLDNSGFLHWIKDPSRVIPALIVVFILGQAALIQVTSYTPIDGNIYFHSFFIGFVLLRLSRNYDLSRPVILISGILLIGLWWSNVFWVRFIRPKVENIMVSQDKRDDQVISKNTYILGLDSLDMKRSNWVNSDIKTFKNVKLPEATIEGIHQLKSLPVVQNKADQIRVLNMSELTQLAYELPYTTEKGPDHPLWYHYGVSFFEREIDHFCHKINNREYDLILFQDIPDLNNFYPYEVRECILEHYELTFKFLAPRIPEFSFIEVYQKKGYQEGGL